MATHEIQLQVPAQSILNKDMVVGVKVNNAPLGRLKISRGSVDWFPGSNSVNGFRLSWTKFAKLMEDNGSTTV